MIYNVVMIIFIIVILFEYWYICRLRKVMKFTAEMLRKYAQALVSDNPKENLERAAEDVRNYK